jgi:hypothetical protein
MTKDDDWTVWTGWRKASWRLPVRVGSACGICWGGFWLVLLLVSSLEKLGGESSAKVPLGLLVLVGAVCGWIAGIVLSRKLAEGTGLLGRQLVFPVIGLLAFGLIRAFFTNHVVYPQ